VKVNARSGLDSAVAVHNRRRPVFLRELNDRATWSSPEITEPFLLSWRRASQRAARAPVGPFNSPKAPTSKLRISPELLLETTHVDSAVWDDGSGFIKCV
jgi:hypothetical protein